jgi:hypothetical protein
MDPVTEYWMQRVDAQMERANEIAERQERAFERHTAAFQRWEAQQDDMREFMRAITLRVERAGREHSREIRRMGDEIVAELREGRAEFRQEMGAQRGALLAILDRLQPGDSGSAA